MAVNVTGVFETEKHFAKSQVLNDNCEGILDLLLFRVPPSTHGFGQTKEASSSSVYVLGNRAIRTP